MVIHRGSRDAWVSPSTQWVFTPVTDIATLAPCSPELGVMPVIAAAEELTVKTKLKMVPLLVRLTVRLPANAVLAMLILIFRWVSSLTVIELTAMLGPKFAVGVVAVKLVNVPTTLTSSVAPCRALVGDTLDR